MKIKISPSILSADFTILGQEIKKCEEAGTDSLHIDIMDGHFVPNFTLGPVIISALKKITKLPLEVHLMIEDPGVYLEDFIKAGADMIEVHAECYGPLKPFCQAKGKFPKEIEKINVEQISKDLKKIRSLGAKAGVVLNPGTPLCLEEILDRVDGVMLMSVNPGFSNQKFSEAVLPKISSLRKIYSGDIKIDGGINAATAPLAVKAGANILATASYFFSSADPKKLVADLKALGEG